MWGAQLAAMSGLSGTGLVARYGRTGLRDLARVQLDRRIGETAAEMATVLCTLPATGATHPARGSVTVPLTPDTAPTLRMRRCH